MKFQVESIHSRTNVYKADIKSASLDLSGAAVFLQQSPVQVEIFCPLLQEFEKSCPLPPLILLTHTRVVASGEASGARPAPPPFKNMCPPFHVWPPVSAYIQYCI